LRLLKLCVVRANETGPSATWLVTSKLSQVPALMGPVVAMTGPRAGAFVQVTAFSRHVVSATVRSSTGWTLALSAKTRSSTWLAPDVPLTSQRR
jgi:hypothetical protein